MKPREAGLSADSEYFNHSPSVAARQSLLYPLCVGRFGYRPGYALRRTAFDSFLLEIVQEGSADFSCGDTHFMAQRGDAVLLDCYAPHSYRSEAGWQALWLHFDGAAARGYFDWIARANGGAGSAVRLPGAGREILRPMQEIYGMFARDGAPDEPRMALELTAALTALIACAARPARNRSAGIDAAVYQINEHFDEPLSLRELADSAALSEYHFIRVFRAAVGMTPQQYLITVRMDHAKYLLRTTDLTVQQAAYAVGYGSESAFCAAFRRSVGKTPSQYRNFEQ